MVLLLVIVLLESLLSEFFNDSFEFISCFGNIDPFATSLFAGSVNLSNAKIPLLGYCPKKSQPQLNQSNLVLQN